MCVADSEENRKEDRRRGEWLTLGRRVCDGGECVCVGMDGMVGVMG